ncbi:annexin A5-like [Ptychodera flava]|uniref:annexin A5-like n=1 Tax=Ptychodera flava TaxID=63121 RepID=UPI00396A898C
MLVSLLQANRSESTEVDEGQAKTDAQELKNVFYATFGGDKSVPITIFVNRSYDQLRATFNEYATLTNSTILADIESKLSGNLAKAFLTIASLVIDDVKYYAKTLYDSMKGLGTRDAILMFVVTRTYRTKMKEIKPAYLKEYGETLTSWIEDDTSGAYKRSLLALVGPEGGEEAPAESTDQAAKPETQDQGQEQATEQAAEAPAEEPPAEATEQAAE